MLKNRSMPDAVVIPVLPYPDIDEAIDWLGQAFGFVLRLRIGDHRAQLSYGDGAIVVTKAQIAPNAIAPSIMVRVEDAYAHSVNALRCGARLLAAPADYPYGERQYSVACLAGHHWTFSQTVSDADPEAWGGALFNV